MSNREVARPQPRELYNVAEKRSEQMAKDVDWMQSIRGALDNDGFVLYYQPLLHIRSGEMTHYEALLRLKTEQGLVSPQTFLPAAVRFGLMADIDRWVIEQRGAVARRVRRRRLRASRSGSICRASRSRTTGSLPTCEVCSRSTP